jgi:hypothetical protein
MSREQVFDSEMKKFFDVCIKILESHDKAFLNLNPTSDHHVLRNLQRYRTVYNMTQVETHIPYFQKLFRNNRDDLLNTLRDDKWLQDENIVIQFGEELEDEELRKRSAKRKIELSTIYKCALKLREHAEESLKGLPESAHDSSHELIYPEILLLHLFRILSAIYPQNKDLTKNIQCLEKELGISAKKSNHPLENIAENAKSLLSGVLPSNLKMPSNDEINQKLETAFKDPLVSETLGSTVSSLLNANNLGEGLSLAMKSLENPKFMDGLMRAVQTLIPAETLETIVKSTESLSSSGELKDALSKMGLSGDLDVNKILSPVAANPVAIEPNPEPRDTTIESTGDRSTGDRSEAPSSEAPKLVLPDLSKIPMEDLMSNLMKNVPPELLNVLSQLQNKSTSSAEQAPTIETKSLIDL